MDILDRIAKKIERTVHLTFAELGTPATWIKISRFPQCKISKETKLKTEG